MSASAPDLQPVPDLAAELTAINSSPTGWSSRRAARLLSYTQQRLAGVARREGATAEDAVHAAWMAWQEPGARAAENPWTWTFSAVRRALANEQQAQRLLTSTNARHREDYDPTVTFDSDGLDAVADLAAVQTRSDRPVFSSLAARTGVALLANAGVDEMLAEAVIDAMLDLAAEASTSPKSASDKLSRERDMPARLGIDVAVWKALVNLLFGSSRGDHGLLGAEREGIDFGAVKQIRNAQNRLAVALNAA